LLRLIWVYFALSSINIQDWWRTSGSQGPIIENGTHLCDLSRYFGGDVELDSIVAHAVEADEKPGILSRTNFDNNSIPVEDRIPRVTSASW
jgi:predicted dehydrogenase